MMHTEDTIEFVYVNHRGERARRRVRLDKNEPVWFGTTEWHPKPQLFLRAYDLDKNAWRDFAVADIDRDDKT